MATINASGLNSLFTSSSGGSSSWLTDYMSIKNGSYLKLLKAQYKNEAEANGTSSQKGSVSDLTGVQKNELLDAKSDADELRSAASKLATSGSKSLFKATKTEVTDEETGITKTVDTYDMESITKAVKDFVSSYNKVIDSSLTPTNDQMTKKAAVMINNSKMNKALLSDIGISIGSDYKLTIDEEKFKKADISTIKTLFNGTGSYASQVSTKASEIGSIATKIISNASTGYGSSGSYRTHVESGSLFNGFL